MAILAPLQERFSMKDNKMPEILFGDLIEIFDDHEARYIVEDTAYIESENIFYINEYECIEFDTITKIWRPNKNNDYILIWDKNKTNKTYQTDEEMLEDNGYEGVVIYKNPDYDGALIGVTDNDLAVYDFDKMVEYLIETEGWDETEAIEWIEYNTMRANAYYENSPIIMYPLKKEM